MHKFRFLLLLSIITISLSNIGKANNAMQLREPDSTFLKSYTQNSEFNYNGKYESTVNSTWLKNIITKLIDKIAPILNYSKEISIGIKILIAVLFVFLLFLIFRKTKIYKLFYSKKEIEDIPFSDEELIEEDANIEAIIAEAVSKMQFRKAIRYNYLNVIKILDNREIIQYTKEKTNRDYRFEIKDSAMRNGFSNVTLIYNNIWYGLKEIDADRYTQLAYEFNTFFKQIDE